MNKETFKKAALFQGPRSVCTCGHTGDGGESDHASGTYSLGHGACTHEGCTCPQFTWAKYTEAFRRVLDEGKQP